MMATMRPVLISVVAMAFGGLIGCPSASPLAPDGGPGDAATWADGGDGGAINDAGPGDGGTLPYDPPVDTTPIASLTTLTWQWVPLTNAICRDGSPTGIGVNINPSSPNLVIYMEGGGQCFSQASCAHNPSHYGATEFTPFAASSHTGSIFDRSLSSNAVKDWSFVFVPYCTGDIHGGNNPGGTPIDDTTPQQYVGYVDMKLALARLVPTFSNVTHVLLTGSSAGGAGVTLNYLQTRRAFAGIAVDALDDSGPPMSNVYLASCLQEVWNTVYRFDRTVAVDCGSACSDPSNSGLEVLKANLTAAGTDRFGVLEDTDDSVITKNYGWGSNDCANITSPIPTALTQTFFTAGLLDTRAQVSAYSNFASFYFIGSAHTSLGTGAYSDGTRTITLDGGQMVTLPEWVGQLVSGTATNVGPY